MKNVRLGFRWGFWFSSHSFLLSVWVGGRFSWATVLYMKQFFFSHVCVHLSLKLLCLSLLLINTLRSLLSGSVKHHKLLPQHMKWTRNQPPSTGRATVWKQHTLWLNSQTVNTLAYSAGVGHWMWEVLSYSRTVETFTCFRLVEGILKVWIKEIHVSPLTPLVCLCWRFPPAWIIISVISVSLPALRLLPVFLFHNGWPVPRGPNVRWPPYRWWRWWRRRLGLWIRRLR